MSETLPIDSAGDVIAVRQIVRARTVALGFSLVDQTKMVTAASELARNTLDYGGGGTITLEEMHGERVGLRLIFEDQGSGIADIERALQEGYTTGNGLGLGLSGSRRLVHEFDLQSCVGEGTRVTITRWK